MRWRGISPERLAGLMAVVALHVAALYGLWHYRVQVVQDEVVTLFVDTVTEPPPQAAPPPARAEKPRPEKPRPAETPAPLLLAESAEPTAAPELPELPEPPLSSTPAPPLDEAPPSKRIGPVALEVELAASCPERRPPAYPPLSRRLGEEGKVVLRVELDAEGKVGAVDVAASSGFPRLDEAARAAVKTWRCNPARRDGQPASAVASQPFRFMLEGR